MSNDLLLDDEAFFMAVLMGQVRWERKPNGYFEVRCGGRPCSEQYHRLHLAGKVDTVNMKVNHLGIIVLVGEE